jgi:PleD family two-component response regulator
MPETDIDRGRDVASRLMASVREISLGAKSTERVGVSIGLASWRPGQDWQAVYQNADMDLYENKRRNKMARPAPAPERSKLRLIQRGGIRRRVARS